MKLTSILLLAGCLQLSAKGLSQGVTISKRNAPLQEVFKEIEKQTDYQFFYKERILDGAKPVTIDLRNATIEQVLLACFKDQKLVYKIVDRVIVVTIKPTVELQSTNNVSPISLSPPIDITGRVTDADGNPLIGATVKVKETNKGTTTGNDGVFVLKGVNENATLEISFVGYETYTVAVNNKTSIVASLKIKPEGLNEVVINKGYYSTTQKLNTGDVTSVSGADIQKQPVSNALLALEGRVPGLLVTQQTGAPGGSVNVQIRGRNSIANGSNPFFVVDGVPYTSTMLPNNGYQITGGGNPLNFINPSDIESIDVLKDADATAIYGSQGANGVVLITTKKGKPGKTHVSLNYYSGIGQVSHYLDLLNTKEYLQMRREAFKNDNATPTQINAPDLLLWDTTRYTDWQKELIGGKAHYNDAQLSVSGGTATVQYLIGGSYHKETTVFPGDYSDKKGAIHFNIKGASLDQKFNILFTGNYLADINNLISNDLINNITMAPNAPAGYNPDGSLNWQNQNNPYAYLTLKYKATSNTLVSNISLSYDILKNLELKTHLGYSNLDFQDISLTPMSFFSPVLNVTSGFSYFTNNKTESWTIEPQLNYDTHIGAGKLNALFGVTLQKTTNDGEQLNATGFTSDAILESIRAAANVSVASATNSQYKYNAAFGRLTYDLYEKYVLNLTGRRDGSSRFGSENQFHNFGAIGVAWNFYTERFVQHNLGFISFGKLRASYGTTGNDQIGDYRYLDLYSNSTFPYQGIQTLYPNTLFNPALEWEETKKFEVGLELGLFSDRIFVSANYFRNVSSNQLVDFALPGVTGFTSITKNLPATVENKGYEFLVNTTNVKTKSFSWSSSINLTIPENKLLEYPDIENSPYANTYVVGQPLTIVKTFHLVGVDKQSGIYVFGDAHGNTTFNPSYPNDMVSIINTAPKFYGGFQNVLQYKNFQLDFLLQFVKQVGLSSLFQKYISPGQNAYDGNVSRKVFNDHWNSEGNSSDFQMFTRSYITSAYNSYFYAQYSDYAYSDASFIRLKNLALSYSFPARWKDRLHLSNGKVYIQCQNLLTITKYIGFDPENQTISALPPLRVISAGLSVNF